MAAAMAAAATMTVAAAAIAAAASPAVGGLHSRLPRSCHLAPASCRVCLRRCLHGTQPAATGRNAPSWVLCAACRQFVCRAPLGIEHCRSCICSGVRWLADCAIPSVCISPPPAAAWCAHCSTGGRLATSFWTPGPAGEKGSQYNPARQLPVWVDAAAASSRTPGPAGDRGCNIFVHPDASVPAAWVGWCICSVLTPCLDGGRALPAGRAAYMYYVCQAQSAAPTTLSPSSRPLPDLCWTEPLGMPLGWRRLASCK